jgi:phage-related protein
LCRRIEARSPRGAVPGQPGCDALALKWDNNTHVIILMWTIELYNRGVAAQLEAWPPGVRAGFLRVTELICEHGPALGLPHTRSLGAGLFEIRAKGREGIGRAFFCTRIGQRVVILHAFVKKTEQIPRRELDLARARQREVRP